MRCAWNQSISELEIPSNSTVEFSTKNPIAHRFLHSEIDVILLSKNNRFRAHRILGREIDGTSDSVREFDRLRGGRILAQNPKQRQFPK